MRTLLLLTGACVVVAGCGRKAPPVAVVSPPKAEARQPVLPPTHLSTLEEPDENKVADLNSRPPKEAPPAIILPPKPPAPKPPAEEEEVEPVPPRKPAPPVDPLPLKRIIEQEPRRVEPSKPVPRNPIAAQDMKDIHLLVDTASLASGRMPDPTYIQAALGAAGSPAARLVASGDIILTGARQRESCWAYQKGSATDGGWIVTNSGAEQVNAATAKRWIGAR